LGTMSEQATENMVQKSFSERLLGRSVSPRTDRIVRAILLGVSVLCFLFFAWDHLDLGAFIFPPAPTVPMQQAVVGPYHVTFRLDSGQLVVGDANTTSFVLSDSTGEPTSGVHLVVVANMVTMGMQESPVIMNEAGGGHYSAKLAFGMPGDWRLNITILRPGQPDAHTSFDVGVRWH
ncbi:MAG TPA: FixH family protein, partial [Ktedonobacterales bacterium]|nr:FixH family protein [Ktedonobacterales bacterium]